MNPNLDTLILAIVSHVTGQGGFITKTKLLKLLYLFDVEYYRIKRQTFTGFNWKYYHLGPWTAEYDPLLSKLVVNDFLVRTPSSNLDYDTEFYRPARVVDLNEALPEFKEENILRVVLNNWGDKETGEILDYVYFRTEPMEHGTRNEPLDFSHIPATALPNYTKSSSGKSLKEIRSLRKTFEEKQRAKTAEGQPSLSFTPPKYDDDYWEAMEKLEEMNC